MVVARTGNGTHLARRVKYVAFGAIADFSGLITAQTPLTFGHAAARGANGVAALVYNTDPAFFGPPAFSPLYEGFSSPGPVTISFARDGKRLTSAEVRLKPDIAAPDGVNTTFFPQPEIFGPGQDYEAGFGAPDGFPNFFGTSAAAPHAAGVAALMVQKAGGPGTISPRAVSRIMKESAPARDVDLFFSKATARSDDAEVTITASGQNVAASGFDKKFFQISFRSEKHGQTLNSLTIDLTGTGLVFDPVSFPVQVGSSTGPTITSATPNVISSSITLNFNGFTSGNSLSFGVDRDFTNVNGHRIENGGSSADEVVGARVTAVLSSTTDKDDHDTPRAITGAFRNQLDRGYRVFDGFGMIDAVNAIKLTHRRDHDGEDEE
jgi:subtilisin family serine protease